MKYLLLLVLLTFSTSVFADCKEYKFYCGTGQKFTIGNCWNWSTLSCSKKCGKEIEGYCKDRYQSKFIRKHGCDIYHREDGCSVPSKAPNWVKDYADVFEEACNQHDVAYSVQYKPKSEADSEFYHNMMKTCIIKNKSAKCEMAAWIYYQGVFIGGLSSYRGAQSWWRDSCDQD